MPPGMSASAPPPMNFLDVDFYLSDPWDAYAWLRREAPVWWDAANGFWVVTRHADVAYVSTHPELFCSSQGYRPNVGPDPSLISLDPPRHTETRRLINKGFTPRMVAQLEPHVRDIVTRTLDALPKSGACDFVTEIAMPLPMLVIAELLGYPQEDWRRLQHWSDEMNVGDASKPLESVIQAYQEFCEYHQPVAAEKAIRPSEDLISKLLVGEVDGHRLDADDVLRTALLLLVGGNETTRNTVSGAMLALSRHPAQRAALAADPAALPTAIEEFLRWVTPIMNFRRTATRDVELAGVRIREGEQVVMIHSSANRDESVWPDADVFDVRRTPNPHLAFGVGTHFCLGANLARLEIRVLFEELLRRFPEMHVPDDARVERYPSTFIRGWSAMPVVFGTEARAHA
jgi:cytochrome P450 family 142 subfamily A polypeptide 1